MQKSSLIDKHFYLWAMFIPINSILLIPGIQGTTPAYIMAFASLAIVLMSKGLSNPYFKELMLILYGFFLLTGISQFLLLFSDVDLSYASLVDRYDTVSVVLRNSMFTQSIYLLCCILTFLFVRHFYKETWNKYFFAGAIFLALYGLAEVIIYRFLGYHIDILSNRTFDGHSGSVTDRFQLFSVSFQRLKSLTGEPSMYSLTILPFWIYALHLKRTKTHLLLFLTLILTGSGSALIGIILYSIVKLLMLKPGMRFYFLFIPICALTMLWKYDLVLKFIGIALVDKITLNSYSGTLRSSSFFANMNTFFDMPFYQQLFGTGFGYVRSTDYFSTVLLNNGYIGLLVLTAVFLAPIFKLKASEENKGLKSAIFITFVVLLVSVPELFYLSTWLFLGLVYSKLRLQKVAATTKLQPTTVSHRPNLLASGCQ